MTTKRALALVADADVLPDPGFREVQKRGPQGDHGQPQATIARHGAKLYLNPAAVKLITGLDDPPRIFPVTVLWAPDRRVIGLRHGHGPNAFSASRQKGTSSWAVSAMRFLTAEARVSPAKPERYPVCAYAGGTFGFAVDGGDDDE